MKKSILMLVICVCFVLTGCACRHEWIEADCVRAKTCSKCEESEGEPLGHTWKIATREEPKTCTRCGETEGERLSLQDAFPAGQLRFADGHLLMSTDDLLDLYVLDLKANGYEFERTNQFEQRSEEYKVYYLENASGARVSVAVVQDLQTGLISMVSAGAPIVLDELEITNELMNAVSIIYETCHGAMNNEKWGYINDTVQYAFVDQGYLTKSVCDGLGYVSFVTTDHYEVVATPDLSNVQME